MLERIIKILDTAAKHLNWIPLITGGSIVTAIGAFSGWVASQTEWVSQYGGIAWSGVALGGAAIATTIMIGLAFIRLVWIRGGAIRKWGQDVDSINPLDVEFTRRRIKIQDLVHPIKNSVERKRFVDCELMGPANITFFGINANGVGFIDCDIVVVRPNGAKIANVVRFINVQMVDGTINKCTI